MQIIDFETQWGMGDKEVEGGKVHIPWKSSQPQNLDQNFTDHDVCDLFSKGSEEEREKDS